MKQHTLKGYISAYFSKYASEPNNDPTFGFTTWKPEDPDYVILKEVEVTIDFQVPSAEEFIALRTKGLRDAKAAVYAKAAEEAAIIDQQIEKLLALELSK